MTTERESSPELAKVATMANQRGYSLIEMLVVMGIFTIVMIITTTAFDRLISSGSHQSKTAASQIEGIVGLEMLRRDISHAGYGLPWSFRNTPATAFDEVTGAPSADVGLDPADFNEITPHALSCATAGAGSTNPGSDYLVVKSMLLPHKDSNSTVGKWGYLNYTTTVAGVGVSYVKRAADAESDLRAGDWVVVLASSMSGSGALNKLLLNSSAATDSASFAYQISAGNFTAPDAFQPSDPSSTYIVYGIAGTAPRMPYNRADYYVKRPAADDANFKIPVSCNSGPDGTTGTGILFKAVADHSGGYATPFPLLNCVGDMKVVFALDPLDDGNISYFPAASNAITSLTPQQLRAQLRSVTIYILTHEGKKDRNFTYPSDTVFVGPVIGSTQLTSVGKLWTNAQMTAQFGADWKNYRWKVYSVPVTPKNMQD